MLYIAAVREDEIILSCSSASCQLSRCVLDVRRGWWRNVQVRVAEDGASTFLDVMMLEVRSRCTQGNPGGREEELLPMDVLDLPNGHLVVVSHRE